MFHRVNEVNVLPEFRLRVTFSDGVIKIYDVNQLMKKWEAFRVFKDVPDVFRDVQVDVGGYGIIWNDDLDISCDELYENGIIACEKTCDFQK